MSNGTNETIRQKFLILKPELALKTILLGNDFLHSNNGQIEYNQKSSTVHVFLNKKLIANPLPITDFQANLFTISDDQYPKNTPLPSPSTMFPSELLIASQDQNISEPDLFHLSLEHEYDNLNAFIFQCRTEKDLQARRKRKKTGHVYSFFNPNPEHIMHDSVEKRSIIPEKEAVIPTANLSHLSEDLQKRFIQLFKDHPNIFSRNKHHLGAFTGFQVKAIIDESSPIKCRTPPRTRILPDSCKKDIQKYKTAGLFELSTGKQDQYCANITLVRRSQNKAIKKETKADKFISQQALKKTQKDTRPLTKTLEDESSLFRMTVDFRSLNKVSQNEKTTQLPSIQSIEHNLQGCNVSSFDLTNMYPSIVLEEASRNFFNFYVEDKIFRHARLPQGWAPALSIAQQAMQFTFRDEILMKFKQENQLSEELFPFTSFTQFLINFVDDICVWTKKTLSKPIETHIMCIKATFTAIEQAGFLLSMQKSTFLDPIFTFLGLKWDMKDESSCVNNDRIQAIIKHRTPRSIPELGSRLATIQYYEKHIPLMKRVAIPLFVLLRSKTFVWKQVHAESYGDLLYLMSLQIKTHIFDPTKSLILLTDTSAVESSNLICNWNPHQLTLHLITTKSTLLNTALRNQSPIHRETYGGHQVLALGKPYLLQSTAPVNFMFTDASSLSYCNRMKPFNSFLQNLSEELSLYPNLQIVHTPGRTLFYCDILSRQLDYIKLERENVKISKEQSALIPSLINIPFGSILTNEELLNMFHTNLPSEFFDVSESTFRYIQRIDWSLYNNPSQFFSSEKEFIIGSLISRTDPELAMKLPSIADIFRIKESATHFKTKAQKILFLKNCAKQLELLPYNSTELEKIKTFLKTKAVQYNVPAPDHTVTPVLHFEVSQCQCNECKQLITPVCNSILHPFTILTTLEPFLKYIDFSSLTNFSAIKDLQCAAARDKSAARCLDEILTWCTSQPYLPTGENSLFLFQHHYNEEQITITFDGSQVLFRLKDDLILTKGEIKTIKPDWVSNIQLIPEIDSPLQDPVICAPEAHFNPWLCIPTVNLANCTEISQKLSKDTILLQIKFKQDQIVGIFTSIDQIISKDFLQRNVLNFSFLKSVTKAVSSIATTNYVRDVTVYSTRVAKRLKKVRKQSDHSQDATLSTEPEVSNSIHHLNERQEKTILQSCHLLNKLLDRHFFKSKGAISEMQDHDLGLLKLKQMVLTGKLSNFQIKNNILYKKSGTNSLLCVPEILLKQIVFDAHTSLNFHFNNNQLHAQFKPIIFHPNLSIIIKNVVDKCGLCMLSQPKIVRNLIGMKRSETCLPNETIAMDSLYLPRSTHGYSKALILVDVASSRVVIYASKDLTAPTVRKHVQTFLQSHPLPKSFLVDFGTEFRDGLADFLASFNIELQGTKPYAKGSTANCESSIRLVKQALRSLCLTNTTTWPELLPIVCSKINQMTLYNTTTRDSIFYSPYLFSNALKLNNLDFPERLFHTHHDEFKSIIRLRENRLKKRAVLDVIQYQKGNIVFALNVPSSQSHGDSKELKMTVDGLYYVKDVQPAHLRLIGLLSGTERSLPREFCKKLNMNDLSQLQFALQSKQLSKVHHRLVEANRFLHPDQEKSWSTLLQNKIINDEDPAKISDPEPMLESVPMLESEQPGSDNQDQIVSKKVLRSGRAYFTSQVQLKHILHGKKVNTCRSAPVPNHQTSAYNRALSFADAIHGSVCELHGSVCTKLYNSEEQPEHKTKVDTNPVKISERKKIIWDSHMKIKYFDKNQQIFPGNFECVPIRDNDEMSLLQMGLIPSHTLSVFALAADFSVCEALYKTWKSPPTPTPPT